MERNINHKRSRNRNSVNWRNQGNQKSWEEQPHAPVIGDLNEAKGVTLLPESTSACERADELEGEIARGCSCRGMNSHPPPCGRHLRQERHCELHELAKNSIRVLRQSSSKHSKAHSLTHSLTPSSCSSVHRRSNSSFIFIYSFTFGWVIVMRSCGWMNSYVNVLALNIRSVL